MMRSVTILIFLAVAGSACKSAPTVRGADKALPHGSVGTGSAPADPQAVAAAFEKARGQTEQAAEHAMKRCVGWQTLPEDMPWKEILDPDRSPDGSFSADTVSDGVLLGGVELPVSGEAHSVIERHRGYDTRYGTAELVDLIQRAAMHVKIAEGGAPLRVGNMSKEKGGDIRWSRSHNSGRDADLAFYVVDAISGESIPAPDLVSFDHNAEPEGRNDVRFDVARNWRLVEGLLSQEDVNVQWLFISVPLKELLLDHARQSSADPEVIRRAESILHQPTDSRPHGDHFHLRIGCPKDDRLDGCLDYGPQWDWYDWHHRDLLARSLQLAKVFQLKGTAPKRRALEFLDQIKSPYAADIAGVWGLWDDDEQVRGDAMEVAYGQYSWTANALVQIMKYVRTGELPSSHLWRAYTILRRSRDELAKEFALERLADTAVQPAEQEHAARSLGHFMDSALVPVLIEQLANPEPGVRNEVAAVLRRITNHSEEIDWMESDAASAARGQKRWESWWADNRNLPRAAWLARGFRHHGIKMDGSPAADHVDALLGLLTSAPPHVVYNANRTVRDLTGRWAPLEQEDGRKLHKYWDKWWSKNRQRVLVGDLGADDGES